jgi:integrase/recombinase XerD
VPAASDASVLRVLNALARRDVTPRTIAQNRHVLDRFFDWCDAHQIHPLLINHEALADFTEELSRTLARSSVATNQSALNVFYAEAVRQEVILRSPMSGFRRSSPKHTYVPASLVPVPALRALRAGAATMDDRAQAVIDLLVLNGLETAEITDATVDGLRSDGTCHWLSVTGRGGARRDIRLAPAVVGPLLGHVGQRRSGPLLLGREGSGMDRHALARIVRRAAVKGGTDSTVTPRDIRNTFISVALGQGLPLDAIRDYVGMQDVRGLDRLVSRRGSAADVPLRVAQSILSDAESGLLDQARRLLDLETPVHVAAPVVLIGAALEEHLRAVVNREALPVPGTGSIMAYAGALRAAGRLEAADMASIDSWARLRNEAAHGNLGRLSRDSTEAMFLGVRSMLARAL